MKLRCTPRSVRFRLNQEEVTQFVKTGELEERVEFPGSEGAALLYRLQAGAKTGEGEVRFQGGQLTMTVPAAQARAWANRQDEVGLYYNYEWGGGKSLRVMIEKDFGCHDRQTDEAERTGYPTPMAKDKCKTEAK